MIMDNPDATLQLPEVAFPVTGKPLVLMDMNRCLAVLIKIVFIVPVFVPMYAAPRATLHS